MLFNSLNEEPRLYFSVLTSSALHSVEWCCPLVWRKRRKWKWKNLINCKYSMHCIDTCTWSCENGFAKLYANERLPLWYLQKKSKSTVQFLLFSCNGLMFGCMKYRWESCYMCLVIFTFQLIHFFLIRLIHCTLHKKFIIRKKTNKMNATHASGWRFLSAASWPMSPKAFET